MYKLEQIYAKWRTRLLHTNFILVMFIFAVEVFMYFVLKMMNLIEQPINIYLTWFLIVPTFLDAFILITGNFLVSHLPEDNMFINYIPVIQIAAICLVVAGTHNIFSVTLCLFCVPLYTTVLFSDKKMTGIIGLLCLCGLCTALMIRRFSAFRPVNDRYFWAEAIVAAVALSGSFILCNVLIAFSKEETNIIRQSCIHEREMQELINRDQETGLFGHAVFMNTLADKTENAERTNIGFALAIIDIDDFKKVNDTYGHLKGDQIIVTFANLMKEYFNKNQYIARYGGEEFAIILPEEEIEKEIELIEELRSAFENQKYSFMNEKITISIGIAKWRKGWTSERLFEAADSAMYASKAVGKNKVTVYELQLE